MQIKFSNHAKDRIEEREIVVYCCDCLLFGRRKTMKVKYDKSRKVSGSIMVDEDKKGKILGIEVLDASKNVPAFNPKKVEFTVQSV